MEERRMRFEVEVGGRWVRCLTAADVRELLAEFSSTTPHSPESVVGPPTERDYQMAQLLVRVRAAGATGIDPRSLATSLNLSDAKALGPFMVGLNRRLKLAGLRRKDVVMVVRGKDGSRWRAQSRLPEAIEKLGFRTSDLTTMEGV